MVCSLALILVEFYVLLMKLKGKVHRVIGGLLIKVFYNSVLTIFEI